MKLTHSIVAVARLVRVQATRRLAAGLLSGLLPVAAGCQTVPERPYEIPHGTVAAPVGTASSIVHEAQELAAEQADFVLYNQNWYQGGQHLGPEGQRRLNRMIQRLPDCPLPVLIEPQPIIIRPERQEMAASGDEAYLATVAAAHELDEYRRALVVSKLMEAGIPGAEERVFIDFVPPGLYGVESPMVASQWMGGMMMGRGRGMGGRGMGMGMGGMGGMGMGGMGMGGMGMGGMGMGRGGMGGMGGMGGRGFGGMGGGF